MASNVNVNLDDSVFEEWQQIKEDNNATWRDVLKEGIAVMED